MQYLLRNLQRDVENKKSNPWLRIKNVVPWKKNKICASYKEHLLNSNICKGAKKKRKDAEGNPFASLRFFFTSLRETKCPN